MKKIALTTTLTVCCLLGGYSFYKLNGNDTFNAVFFTLGILGIMLSVLRNASRK